MSPGMVSLLLAVLSLMGGVSAMIDVKRMDKRVKMVCESQDCEFTLIVHHARSMTYQGYPLTVNAAGTLVYTDGDGKTVPAPLDSRQTITADGVQREIIAVNGQFPAPTIEVYKGARMAINVVNQMPHDATTVHWHGQQQRGTPWSDGTAYVTQCPIQPGQNLTYRFIANPSGTFFYHPHIGSQRADGLVGVLIVHDRAFPQYPSYIPALITDWLKVEAHVAHPIRPFDKPSVGSDVPRPTSILINGRGRTAGNEKLPLEVFHIGAKKDTVFRLANAAVRFAFKVSVDDHKMIIEAMHGSRLNVPVPVDAFIINPADRVDFRLVANKPTGRYWMRAYAFTNNSPTRASLAGLAIVSYDGSSEDPKTKAIACSVSDPCTVFNCPFPSITSRKCSPVFEAAHRYPDPYSVGLNAHTYTEIFINVASVLARTLNGRLFIEPKAPYYQPRDFQAVDCRKACMPGRKEVCSCTTRIPLTYNTAYQFVVSNLHTPNGTAFNPHTVVHPMHIHGHDFAVIKMGMGKFDPVSGKMLGDSDDLVCVDPPLCSKMKWAPGKPDLSTFNLRNPPHLDVIGVPAGGYAVLRFKATNPGIWLLHCHILTDQLRGMVFLLEEARERIPAPPLGYAECKTFQWNKGRFLNWLSRGVTLKDFPE